MSEPGGPSSDVETSDTPGMIAAAEVPPQQHALALVNGEPFIDVPQDLYIPPDALEVFLEAFEGPLDLLLYLIRRQNLDVLDIPIADITSQYMEYVDLMKNVKLELAGEYLVMAATLAEIKSRLLLPRSGADEEDEATDPRAELIRRLQEYERFKHAAVEVDEMPRMGREIFQAGAELVHKQSDRPPPDVALQELLLAFADVLQRTDLASSHQISQEQLSVRERMASVLDHVRLQGYASLSDLFDASEGRAGVVVAFLAILELVKEKLVVVTQAEAYAQVHIQPNTAESEELY